MKSAKATGETEKNAFSVPQGGSSADSSGIEVANGVSPPVVAV